MTTKITFTDADTLQNPFPRIWKSLWYPILSRAIVLGKFGFLKTTGEKSRLTANVNDLAETVNTPGDAPRYLSRYQLTPRPRRSKMSRLLNVLVMGATGGTGRATVERLVAEGHRVTAFSRHADRLASEINGIITVNGDATDPTAVAQAVVGQDVVIVTLGITENPFRVRFLGPARTPIDVRSRGTKNVIEAMKKHGVRRLIVQSSYGVGATWGFLGFADQLLFNLLLKPQIKDTEIQEQYVRASGLDWVLAQPVHLKDDAADETSPYLSTQGETRLMKVARQAVARFLALAAREEAYVGQSVTVSG